jgi:hypothetical protein
VISRSNFVFIYLPRFIPDAPNPIALKSNFSDLSRVTEQSQVARFRSSVPAQSGSRKLHLGLFGLLMSLSSTVQAANVILAWDPSPGTNVAGYKLHYGPGKGNYTNIVDVGPTNIGTISGVVGGATYFCVVTAYSIAGLESDFSNEVTFRPHTNAPPTLDALPDWTIDEDSGARVINLTGISTGSIKDIQRLTITAQSSNPGLIPTPYVNYVSPNPNGALIFGTRANTNGSAVVTVTVSDGESTFSRTFVVTVLAVNDLPNISFIPNQRIIQNTSTQPLPIAVSDLETPAENLTLSGVSSNPDLVSPASIIFGGTGSNRTVQVLPTPGQIGSAVITVMVNDGSTNVATSFQLTVLPAVEIRILSAARVLSSGFAVRWQSVPGRTYRVCFKDELAETTWNDLTGDITATGFSTSWTDLTFSRRAARYYKVRLVDFDD